MGGGRTDEQMIDRQVEAPSAVMQTLSEPKMGSYR